MAIQPLFPRRCSAAPAAAVCCSAIHRFERTLNLSSCCNMSSACTAGLPAWTAAVCLFLPNTCKSVLALVDSPVWARVLRPAVLKCPLKTLLQHVFSPLLQRCCHVPAGVAVPGNDGLGRHAAQPAEAPGNLQAKSEQTAYFLVCGVVCSGLEV